MQEGVVKVVEHRLVLLLVRCDIEKVEVQIKLSQVEGEERLVGLI